MAVPPAISELPVNLQGSNPRSQSEDTMKGNIRGSINRGDQYTLITWSYHIFGSLMLILKIN